MRPVLDAWVRMIAVARAAGVPVIYTTPVSRADGADVVMLPTDLSADTGLPPLTNAVQGSAEAGFPEEIAPQPEDYVFLKRRPSAFYGTGVAELLHMLRRDTIIIGGGAQIAASRRASARLSSSTWRQSWCANAVGAATRPPTPTASTRRSRCTRASEASTR
jgi:nicotinamidase-related amidase